MSYTLTSKTRSEVDGIVFTRTNTRTGTHIGRINTTFSASAGTTYDLQLFAENSSANKVTAFAITTHQELDLCELSDASDAIQFDAHEASGNVNMVAGTYIFPDSFPFTGDSGQTITTSGNDITKLRVSTSSTVTVTIQAIILYSE